jgi:hypothetical protein
VGVVVVGVVGDVMLDFFADLVSALASFVDVVVVFVFGALDPFAPVVTFGAFVTFAVVFGVFGDGVALAAFGDDTFTGAGPFPFEAASSGASVRLRTIAVPTVIVTMRMRFTSAGRVATEVPSPRACESGISPIYSMPYVMTLLPW